MNTNEVRSASADRMSDPETWVDQHGDYLYRYALSRIQDPTVAEDLVQETFMSALRTRESFEGRSSERTWLTSLLKHKILDHLRKRSREYPLNEIESSKESIDALFDAKGHWKVGPSEWTINPGKVFEQKAFWEVFSSCLSDVPTRMAQVFRLREMDGLNCEEICKNLDVSTTNCYVILHRVRMLLRRCLEIRWFESEAFED